MKYTIHHRPMIVDGTIELTIDKVDQMYEGKGNGCRCGCLGEYYQVLGNEVKIENCLEKMSSGKYKVKSIDNYIFEIVLHSWKTKNGEQQKVQTIYLKK